MSERLPSPGFLVRPTSENAARVLSALQDFGFGSLGLSAADFTKPDNVIQLGMEPNRIDILTSLTGVTFQEAWDSRIIAGMDGVPVNVIGKGALLRNKEATGRAKDRIDTEELRRTR